MGEAKRKRETSAREQHALAQRRKRFDALVKEGANALREMIGNGLEFREALLATIAGRNEVLDHYAAHVDAQTWAQCRKGCSFCCYQEVSAPIVEIFIIADHVIHDWPAGDQALLKERLAKMAALPHETTARPLMACPFLSNHECLIYPIRPLACRGHYSMNRSECEEDHKLAVAGKRDWTKSITLLGDAKEICSGIQLGIDYACLEAIGLDTRRVELCGALLRVFDDIDGVWEKWVSGGFPFDGLYDEPGKGIFEEREAPTHFELMINAAINAGVVGTAGAGSNDHPPQGEPSRIEAGVQK